jgi:hypothetical protein
LYWIICFGTTNIEDYERVSVVDDELIMTRAVNVYTLISGFLQQMILLIAPLAVALFVKLYKEFGIRLVKFNKRKTKLFLLPYSAILIVLVTFHN